MAKEKLIQINLYQVENGVFNKSSNKVYQFDIDEPKAKDIDAMEEMIYDIFESIGFINRKWNKYDITVHKTHGRKYDCDGINCDVCEEIKLCRC